VSSTILEEKAHQETSDNTGENKGRVGEGGFCCIHPKGEKNLAQSSAILVEAHLSGLSDDWNARETSAWTAGMAKLTPPKRE